jgi:bis(5'-adenosyl)-triphosphatase
MSSGNGKPVFFGPFEVTEQVRFLLPSFIHPSVSRDSFQTVLLSPFPPQSFLDSLRTVLRIFQVFYATPLSFALVNLKPLLPGHVLISPHRVVPRFTDLTPAETSDLLLTVQRVQRMLALTYFPPPSTVLEGSFNIAIQDGEEAGQSVPHVHCHIIPRMRGDTKGDEVYDDLSGEKGNVGGKLWDRVMAERPKPGGKFPKIEDEDRMARSKEEMREEAELFAVRMKELEEREKSL